MNNTQIRNKIIYFLFILAGCGMIIFGSFKIKESKSETGESTKKDKLSTGIAFTIVGFLWIIGCLTLIYFINKPSRPSIYEIDI